MVPVWPLVHAASVVESPGGHRYILERQGPRYPIRGQIRGRSGALLRDPGPGTSTNLPFPSNLNLRPSSPPGETRLGPSGYLGLGLTALATLMYEILLTRIFSVTLWHHFAVAAVSIAMFGLTAGAMLVFVLPARFEGQKAKAWLPVSSLLFSIAIALSFVLQLAIRIDPTSHSLPNLLAQAGTYVIVSVPFCLSGIAICLALTKFPAQVSRLYAADLAGAAAGCILIILALRVMGDAPSVILLLSAIAAAGAFCFAREARRPRFGAICAMVALGFLAVAALTTSRAAQGEPLIRLRWVKGEQEEKPLYERWGPHARIKVIGKPENKWPILGWGMSAKTPQEPRVTQLNIVIDGSAGTRMTEFDGDFSKVEGLKYDITNIAHYLRPDADVAIIGAGGGRDVLSALTFGQNSVTAIEMNGEILNAVTGRYGDFTGHLDRDPRVNFIHDEGRSYLTGTDERFDIIQASLIDTWAATSAGAFALSENSLYTVEAWETFLGKLKPGGVLSFTRFYVDAELPASMYRMMSIAREALGGIGASNPLDHVLIARVLWRTEGPRPHGIGTMLVSRDPFSPGDVARLQEVCADLEFEIVQAPGIETDPAYAQIASTEHAAAFYETLAVDLSAPTDDRPFFFQLAKLGDIVRFKVPPHLYEDMQTNAILVLGALLITVIVLSAVFIVAPLALVRPRPPRDAATVALMLYFGSIGFGFMLIEISMMQRLIIFLGHPTYSLAVVLFSMLISSGLGSFSTGSISMEGKKTGVVVRWAALVAIVLCLGLAMPALFPAIQSQRIAIRALASAAFIFPLGFMMGMAFPLGMKLIANGRETLGPWLWGINGAASVVASVSAAVIALAAGIGAAYWTGFACYVIAFWSFRAALARTS